MCLFGGEAAEALFQCLSKFSCNLSNEQNFKNHVPCYPMPCVGIYYASSEPGLELREKECGQRIIHFRLLKINSIELLFIAEAICIFGVHHANSRPKTSSSKPQFADNQM